MYFNPLKVIKNRARAFSSSVSQGKHDCNTLVIDLVLEMILERIQGHFDNVLDLGCHNGSCERIIRKYASFDKFVHGDFASEPLMGIKGETALLDYEKLPFENETFSLVVSAVTLHSVNNLQGIIKQVFRILKPGGVFIGSLFGHLTLSELREAIIRAESIENAKKRISPFLSVKDAGRLIQSAGFRFAAADTELIKMQYDDIWKLFWDLKSMGESNALSESPNGITTKNMLQKIVDCYPGNSATYEIILVTGMKSCKGEEAK